MERGTAGTWRETVSVAVYTGEPVGEPDEVRTVDRWYEADGTEVTDAARIAVIRAAQEGDDGGR